MSAKKSHKVRLFLQADCPECHAVLARLPEAGLKCTAGDGCAFSKAGTVLDDSVELPVLHQPKKSPKASSPPVA